MQLEFKVQPGLSPVNIDEQHLIIVGQPTHLKDVAWGSIKEKTSGRLCQEVWAKALARLNPKPVSSVALGSQCSVLALPTDISRHNSRGRAFHLSRIVSQGLAAADADENVLLVVRREDVFASVCALSRCFSLFTKKTRAGSRTLRTVTVELCLPNQRDEPLSNQDFKMLNEAATSVQMAARIVDTPANIMDVDGFLKEVEAVGKELDIVPTIIRGEDLKERGFGGIYGVGKAAASPPALAVLSHRPPGAERDIAWVGKGIVYDTGGLSMKTKSSMPGMKRDCGGAAGILGAFRLAVLGGFRENLHAVLCLAENAVSQAATRPDDIHTLYSGKTVEINNTDAEGRLVLADGVVYADRDLRCQTIVDMATLTGAQGVATGRHHAAVVTNCPVLEAAAVVAGQCSGDLTHPLPYCPELHFPEFNSTFADMKNSVANRNNAASSCAGLFIASHLGFQTHVKWLHIDMAAPVYYDDRATGYGVALLNTLFGRYSRQELMSSMAPVVEEDSEPNTKRHCAGPNNNH